MKRCRRIPVPDDHGGHYPWPGLVLVHHWLDFWEPGWRDDYDDTPLW